jgi:hypothetical protein
MISNTEGEIMPTNDDYIPTEILEINHAILATLKQVFIT